MLKTLHPRDVKDAPPLLKDSKALILMDIRSTGKTYYEIEELRGTTNKKSVPFWISMRTCLLDSNNTLIPFDELSFRIAVSKYLEFDSSIVEAADFLSSIILSGPEVNEMEYARQDARLNIQTEFLDSYPIREVSIEDYEYENYDEGLSRSDAVKVIATYCNRFTKGSVIAMEDMPKGYSMLERIGLSLEVLPNVYTRTLRCIPSC